MIRTRIYLENNAVDLYDDVAAEFTYAIDDVKEFASRNTSFSKTITIPGSSTNNKLFGHVFEFTSSNPYDNSLPNVGTNFNPAVVANCVILVDNIQIFKGVLRLLQINVDRGTLEYECAVFGELGGFANAITNLKLENLDFSGYDHDWTVENISASWQSINASGYYYPLIDYGKVSTNKHDWQYKALRPAYYVREIIDKIITGAGYTYESSFLDTNLIKRLIIPQNTKVMQQRSALILGASINVASYNQSSNIAFTANTLGDFTYTGGVEPFFTYNNPSSVTSDITISFGGTVNGISPMTNSVQVQLFRNAVLIGLNTFVIDSTPQNFSGVITASNVTFNQNDTLYLRIVINGEFSMSGGVLSVQSQNPEQLIPVNYGETIRMNEHIPKGIYQKDFLTSIVKMFNLYITEDSSKEKHLILSPGNYFYERGEDTLFAINDFGDLLEVELGVYLIIEPGQSAFLDWTKKIDRSKPMVIRPMSELNARFFEYKYRPDNDYYNEQYQKKYDLGYGDRVVDTGFSFGGNKDTAQVIFSATPLVGYAGEDKVYPTIFKLTNVGPSQVEDATDHNIRIMQAKKKTTTSWQILDGATVKGTYTEYGYAGNLDDPKTPENDINFGAPRELYFSLPSGEEYPETNLFSGFWFDYVAEITDKDSKLLTAFVKLNELDIANLNFSRLIFIDGALWRLNKIIDFNTEDTTRVEFLRVIELTYT